MAETSGTDLTTNPENRTLGTGPVGITALKETALESTVATMATTIVPTAPEQSTVPETTMATVPDMECDRPTWHRLIVLTAP